MKKIFLTVIAAVMATTSYTLMVVDYSGAVTANDWRAGRIIDDNVFTDPTEMNVADIQNFLNTQVPNCDTNGTRPASEYGRPDLTHAQYAALRGWPGPPYVCLKDYYEVPKTQPGNYIPANNFSGSIPQGAVSAAQLIYNSSVKYRINPKAILVKIATESAGPLTADTWPMQSQYTYAMGSHCPDSGPNGSANCDQNYAGLSIQLDSGAGLLRWYLDNMQQSWWSYKRPFQTNSILWNVVERGCGAGNVYIESKATAALYTYTPYQPNQAALNNMYGLGDNCSAYGNRNFWRVWNDWFGSGLVPAYAWQAVSQEYYTDSTKTTWSGPTIPAGGKIHLVLKAKNTGSATWSNKDSEYPINLATLPADKNSIFCAEDWLSCNRPARLVENQVVPGGVGTFEFDVTNPTGYSGEYRAYFSLVSEGRAWFNNPAVNFYLIGQKPIYKWSIQAQEAYTDSSMTTPKNMWYTRPGETAYLVIKAKNTGNVTWSNSGPHPVNLAVAADKLSSLCTNEWLSCNRPTALKEATVAPGEVGTFAFPVTIPNKPGDYIEYYSLVSEGRAWFDSTGINYWIKIR
jgi:hypothetical protein